MVQQKEIRGKNNSKKNHLRYDYDPISLYFLSASY